MSGSFGFCLFLAAHSLAFAEQSSSESFVPVEHASFHQLVFADEDVAILNNLLMLEPGQSAPSITQANKGLRVVVRGGLLTTITPGLQDQHLASRRGLIRALAELG